LLPQPGRSAPIVHRRSLERWLRLDLGAGDGVDLTKVMTDEASFDHEGATRVGSLPTSSGRSTAADPAAMVAPTLHAAGRKAT